MRAYTEWRNWTCQFKNANGEYFEKFRTGSDVFKVIFVLYLITCNNQNILKRKSRLNKYKCTHTQPNTRRYKELKTSTVGWLFCKKLMTNENWTWKSTLWIYLKKILVLIKNGNFEDMKDPNVT